MIKQYHQRCREEEYQPLGRSTLYRILTVREASQRKSLQGLDNTAASGAEGFDTLSRIVDALEQYGTRHEWCEESRDKLKEAKSYRKSTVPTTVTTWRICVLITAEKTRSAIHSA